MNIELLEEVTTELSVPQRANLALGADKARVDLAALVAKSADIKEIKNAAGRAECHAAAMVLVKARTTIAATGKAARDDATKFSKAVIATEAELAQITAAEEKRLLELRDTWDAQVAIEKAKVEQAEREQAARIQARIDNLGFNLSLVGAPSASIKAEIKELTTIEVSLEVFGARAGEAQQIKLATLEKLAALHASALVTDAQQAAIEAQKAEQAAAAEKLAFERRLMEEERAAIQASLDAQRAQLANEQAAARKVEQDRVDEANRLAREAAAAAQKILDDAAALERQRLNQEAAEQRAKQAAEDEAAAEASRLAAVARNAAADAAFIKDQRVRNAAGDMLELLQSVVLCIQAGAIVAPNDITQAIQQVINQATGEAA